MKSLHLDMPEHLAQYVAAQAGLQHASAEAYVLALVEQALAWHNPTEAMRRFKDHLDACDRQIDEGNVGSKTVDEIIAEGEARFDRRHGG